MEPLAEFFIRLGKQHNDITGFGKLWHKAGRKGENVTS
jgi:hypothetical protein